MTVVLEVRNLVKTYSSGIVCRNPTFRLQADFVVEEPTTIGILGPNGSGKTTLFELITGSNSPSSGEVLVEGRNIHKIRTTERDRLAIHYHQSYQVRRFRSFVPGIFLERAARNYPVVHLFDEPQFNIQDGYIGFMLDFFRKLRKEKRLVFLCLHPNESFHLEILEEICDKFIFIQHGEITVVPDYKNLLALESVQAYLGKLLTETAT